MDDQLNSEPLSGSTPPVTRDRGRGFRSGVLAAGAAVGMTLAGLGVANAQTDNTTPTTPTTEAPIHDAALTDRPHPGKDCDGPGRHGAGLATAASTIGVTEEELRTALHSGQSLAQVAQSKGVAPQKVIDAMVAESKTRLADAVKSGDLTQAQADEKTATLTERITGIVNRTGGPGRGPRGMHRGGARPGATEGSPSVFSGSDDSLVTL